MKNKLKELEMIIFEQLDMIINNKKTSLENHKKIMMYGKNREI
jgi:hypothetical protein